MKLGMRMKVDKEQGNMLSRKIEITTSDNFGATFLQFRSLVTTPAGCRWCPDELAAGVRGASSPALWTQSCGRLELSTIGSIESER